MPQPQKTFSAGGMLF